MYRRAAVVLILGGLAAAAVGPAGGADELPDFATLQARIAAATGPSPENFRETISTSAFTDTTFRRGRDVRTVSDDGPIHSERGIAHGEAWHQDPNGLTVVDEPIPDAAATTAPRPTIVRVSRPIDAYKLSVLDANGYGTVEFVDPATYRIVRSERIGAVDTIVTSNDAFATFGSRQLPSRWTVTDTATNAQRVVTRSDYREGAVTDADVTEPAIRRTLVEFPAGVTSVELPVRFQNNRIYVHVTVDGRPLDFVLASGNASVTIDENVARELSLPLLNGRRRVVADRFRQYDTIVPGVGIGPLTMRNIVMRTIPHGTQTEASPGFAGVLGFDFLAQLGVTIDYQHQRVTVRPAAMWTAPHGPNVVVMPVRLPGGVPEVGVAINGELGERFVLDTGSNGSVLVTDVYARAHEKALGPPARRGNGTGVGGSFATTLYLVTSVNVANVHFRDVRVSRVDSPRTYPGGIDGVVGTDLLRLFTLDLHYADGTVDLTRNGIL